MLQGYKNAKQNIVVRVKSVVVTSDLYHLHTHMYEKLPYSIRNLDLAIRAVSVNPVNSDVTVICLLCIKIKKIGRAHV